MLELINLSRRYGNTIAMDDLSFTVSAGEVVGFLGPNGAGKTTAMRSVLGVVQPDAGEVRWQGNVVGYNERLRFGSMPEERGLYPTMEVIDQLIYLGRLHGMSKPDARNASMEWLEMLGIAERSEERLDALSMGNQQRVQIAAALVHSPELLVLDEPFSGLDPTGIEALSGVLQERAKQGVAVVFSSHQLDLVENLCERVVIINKGHTIVTGTTEDLTTSETTLMVRVIGDTDGSWMRAIPGAHLERFEHGTARLTIESPSLSDTILDAARAAGSVQHFSFTKRRLSEVFREAVKS